MIMFLIMVTIIKSSTCRVHGIKFKFSLNFLSLSLTRGNLIHRWFYFVPFDDVHNKLLFHFLIITYFLTTLHVLCCYEWEREGVRGKKLNLILNGEIFMGNFMIKENSFQYLYI